MPIGPPLERTSAHTLQTIHLVEITVNTFYPLKRWDASAIFPPKEYCLQEFYRHSSCCTSSTKYTFYSRSSDANCMECTKITHATINFLYISVSVWGHYDAIRDVIVLQPV